MYFSSWAAFFAMGGHAPYVWASYGLMAFSLAALIMASRVSQQRWLKQQRRRRHVQQRAPIISHSTSQEH